MRRALTALVPILGLTACGYTDGGGGSKTLEVKALLTYKLHDNAIDANIDVNKDNVTVDGATVTLTDGDKGDIFTIDQRNNGNHAPYHSSITGYHRKLALKVENGDDKLYGQIEGPGSHIISNPDANEVMDRADMGSSFEVRWSTNDGIAADEVAVHLHDFDTSIQDDRGNCNVPTSKLVEGTNKIEVERLNRVTLDGGILASVLELAYSVEIEVSVPN